MVEIRAATADAAEAHGLRRLLAGRFDRQSRGGRWHEHEVAGMSKAIARKRCRTRAAASNVRDRVWLLLISLIAVIAIASPAFDAGQTMLDLIVVSSSLAFVSSALWLSALENRGERKSMLLENARLVEELRASRARIVATAQTERLRLERDLHDGAQQRLLAIQIKLGSRVGGAVRIGGAPFGWSVDRERTDPHSGDHRVDRGR